MHDRSLPINLQIRNPAGDKHHTRIDTNRGRMKGNSPGRAHRNTQFRLERLLESRQIHKSSGAGNDRSGRVPSTL